MLTNRQELRKTIIDLIFTNNNKTVQVIHEVSIENLVLGITKSLM